MAVRSPRLAYEGTIRYQRSLPPYVACGQRTVTTSHRTSACAGCEFLTNQERMGHFALTLFTLFLGTWCSFVYRHSGLASSIDRACSVRRADSCVGACVYRGRREDTLRWLVNRHARKRHRIHPEESMHATMHETETLITSHADTNTNACYGTVSASPDVMQCHVLMYVTRQSIGMTRSMQTETR